MTPGSASAPALMALVGAAAELRPGNWGHNPPGLNPMAPGACPTPWPEGTGGTGGTGQRHLPHFPEVVLEGIW